MKRWQKQSLAIMPLWLVLTLSGCDRQEELDAKIKTRLVIDRTVEEKLPQDVATSGVPSGEKRDAVQYFDGTGILAKEVRGKPAVTQEVAGTVTLTFKNTDVRTILKAVLSDTLGETYSIDPRVQGSATLETSGPISKEALRSTLDALLKTKGFAIVDTTSGLQVLPLADAPRSVANIRHNQPASVNLPGFGVQVVPLKFTSPSEMQRLIEPFSPQGGVLSSDDERGFLILAGTSQELAAMMRAVETFDVDWMAGMSFAIFPLKYAEVETVVKELGSIFGASGKVGASNVRFIPIPRINRLLAIAPKSELLRTVEFWISKLDLGESSPGRRIYVYQVKNGRANDLAQTLNTIVGAEYGYGNTLPSNQPQAAGRYGQRRQILSGMERSSGQGGEDTFASGGIRIVPNEENNSILILATPSEFGVVETALRQVDLPPRQVLIEVTIAEVALTDELRYGLQWHFEFGENSVSFARKDPVSADGIVFPAEYPSFSWGYTNNSSATAVLNALESMTDIQVISSPKLLVLNNQAATLQVGDEVPVPTTSSVSNDNSNARTVNSIQYRNTGVILTVTPRINEGGLIMLDVEQEVSNVVETSSSGIDAPTIQQRRLTSSVAIQNGSTVALGGLIRQTTNNVKSGVPVLKDIPLLGAAFRSTDIVERRSEMVILLTPRIIRDVAEQREVMDYLQREFRSLIEPATPDESSLEEVKEP